MSDAVRVSVLSGAPSILPVVAISLRNVDDAFDERSWNLSLFSSRDARPTQARKRGGTLGGTCCFCLFKKVALGLFEI